MIRKLILVSVLVLSGCDNTFPLLDGKGLKPEDAEKLCTDLGGKIEKDKVQIGVSTSIWTSSLSVSFTCDLSERGIKR